MYNIKKKRTATKEYNKSQHKNNIHQRNSNDNDDLFLFIYDIIRFHVWDIFTIVIYHQ